MKEGVIRLSGSKVEHWKFWTMFGCQGAGKSTICRRIGRGFLKKKWRVAFCDALDEPHPRGAIRVRDVDHARKVLEGHANSVFIHCEAHRDGVGRKDRVHPWLLDLVHEYRHGGPSLLLATQFPYELDLELRRGAKDGSFILYMGTDANLEFLKRNFDRWVYEKVSGWKDPGEEGEIRWMGPVRDGGRQ